MHQQNEARALAALVAFFLFVIAVAAIFSLGNESPIERAVSYCEPLGGIEVITRWPDESMDVTCKDGSHYSVARNPK